MYFNVCRGSGFLSTVYTVAMICKLFSCRWLSLPATRRQADTQVVGVVLGCWAGRGGAIFARERVPSGAMLWRSTASQRPTVPAPASRRVAWIPRPRPPTRPPRVMDLLCWVQSSFSVITCHAWLVTVSSPRRRAANVHTRWTLYFIPDRHNAAATGRCYSSIQQLVLLRDLADTCNTAPAPHVYHSPRTELLNRKWIVVLQRRLPLT